MLQQRSYEKEGSYVLRKSEIVNILKEVHLENIEENRSTSFFFTSKRGRDTKAFEVSVRDELVTATIVGLLFKRRYNIHRREL